jgi:septum site-determining protein MinC
MADRRVVVRGTSDGLIIEIETGDWESVLRELDQRLGQSASFFRGGRVALRVGARILNRDEIEALGRALERWDVSLWGVESDALETRAAASSLGLETRLLDGRLHVSQRAEEPPSVTPAGAISASEGMAIRRTLRSGASVVHRGHILIVGDVNAGAEVIAGGNIVVWGKLRGLAHAGAEGDESAIVCALRMSPSQLRIGKVVCEFPRPPRAVEDLPHMAFVEGGSVRLEPWADSASQPTAPARNRIQWLWRRIIGSVRDT